MDCLVSIDDVANWFLYKESMTPKKLQKLCYYAYSWFLYFNNDNLDNINIFLFNEDFEAWVHGPVNRKLYNKYKNYSYHDIDKLNNKVDLYSYIDKFLEDVWNEYGKYNGDELESISHQELPWINARKGLKSYESSSNILDVKDMFKEYSSR